MKSFIIAIAAAMPLYAQDAPAPAAQPQNPEQQKCSCQCSCGERQGHRHHRKAASPFVREAHKLILAKYDKDGDGKLNDEEKAALQADAKAMMEQKKAAFLAKYDKDGDGKLSDEEKAAMKADFQAKREQRHAEFAQKHPEIAAKMEQKKAAFLAKYDKDGDGKLSDEEKAAMKADFQAKRGQEGCQRPDGPRGPKAHRHMHKGMFARMMVGRALMLEKYDADKDGKLSREELGDLAPKGDRCGKDGWKGHRGPKGGPRHGHHGHGPQQAPAPAPQQ